VLVFHLRGASNYVSPPVSIVFRGQERSYFRAYMVDHVCRKGQRVDILPVKIKKKKELQSKLNKWDSL
jgi:hypothetical protein